MLLKRFQPWVVPMYAVPLVFHSVNKLWLRPRVLEADAPVWLDIFVLSVPNTIESLVGLTWLATVFMLLKDRGAGFVSGLGERTIYLSLTAFVAVYVITQEVRLHDLGGRNVYDPWDVVGSVVGILVVLVLLLTRGVLRDPPAGPR